MRLVFRIAFLLGAWMFLPAEVLAGLQLPSLIGDHMVLQQGMALPVWGKDLPAQAVTVSLCGKSVVTQTGSDGKWKVLLPPLLAGGPFEMTLSGSSAMTLSDVWVGEVWVASGQSNMELPLNNTKDSKQEIASAGDPQIHWFVQDRATSTEPLEEASGSWKVCSPETASGFSAAAYYFAKHLHRQLGAPVGILATYWGGTWIESWIPRRTFQSDPSLQPLLQKWDDLSAEDKQEQGGVRGSELEIWGLRLLPKDPGQEPLTISLAPPVGERSGQTLGGYWSSNAQPGASINFSSLEGGGPGPGPVGKLTADIPSGGWGNANTSFAPNSQSRDLSAYDTIDFYARGRGKFNVLLFQPIVTDWDNYGSQPFKVVDQWRHFRFSFSELTQSGWGKQESFNPAALQAICFNAVSPAMPQVPSILYNAMVNPLIPYAIKGVIWYQGETNVGQAESYQKLLPALIRGWRTLWGEGDFPFIFAQLPNFLAPKPEPANSAWAELREAQRLSLQVPNTGMPVLIDIGEADNIHPKDKRDVGDRLALWALHLAYGLKGSFSGPLFDSMKVEKGKIRINFLYGEEGLLAKGGEPLKGFAIAGKDGIFQWARAKIEGSTLLVWNDQIPFPQKVRYAWADNPDCNLFGKNGLPAAPFQCEASGQKPGTLP